MTRAIVVAVLLLPSLAWAVGETNGRIAGTVTETATKKNVAGADVVVAGDALIGGARTTQTDDAGHYELVELPPGVYDVEAGYPGFAPARRRIVVRQGETAPLDISWSATSSEVKTYNIVEELHLTRPDSTQQGTVISADQANKVATGRTYQNIAQ